MRVNKIAIGHRINIQYNQVLLQLQPQFEELLLNIDIAQYPQWIQQSMQDYYLINKISSNTIKFEYRTVLMETDHSQLVAIIRNILNEFIVYEIAYPFKYQSQIQLFKDQFDCVDLYYRDLASEDDVVRTVVYFHNQASQQQQYEYRINKLQQFQQQVLIYPIRDQLKQKISIQNKADLRIFMHAFSQNYAQHVIDYVHQGLKNIGMRGSAVITQISYFMKEDTELLKQQNIDISCFIGIGGFIFRIGGYQQSFCKLYIIFQKWLQKLTTTIVEVETIQCCKRDRLSQYYSLTYNNSYAALLQPNKEGERILIFNPPKLKQSNLEFQIFFKTSKRIITALQYPQHNFTILNELWNQFVRESQLRFRTTVNEDFLLVSCTRVEQKSLRQKITRFFDNYRQEEHKVNVFANQFEVSLFQNIYLKKFSIKNTKFYTQEKSLFASYYKKDEDAFDKQIRDIYQQMKKKTIFFPISKSLPVKKSYFRESRAVEWESTQSLQWMQFKMQDRITVNVRSYGSLSNNEQQCIFMIQDFQKCKQLIQIMKQDGYTSYQKRIQESRTQNGCMGFTLHLCKYFDNITTCIINTRNNRWQRRAKETFQQLIENHKNSRHLKFMFHNGSEESVRLITPIILKSLLASCQLRTEVKIKQVTFFISVQGDKLLRKAVINSLSQIRDKSRLISKICDLNLEVFDIQKILAYGYCSFKYFQNQTTLQASPLNSYIFYTQSRKKKNIPIFLPECNTIKQNQQCEYLVSCLKNTVFKISNDGKIDKMALNERLSSIKSILKHYFSAIEYFVIKGNKEGTHFCQRLFYTSNQQKHYNKIQEVKLEVDNQKILLLNKFYKYSFIKHQFTQLKKIETHASKVQELKQLLTATSLK